MIFYFPEFILWVQYTITQYNFFIKSIFILNIKNIICNWDLCKTNKNKRYFCGKKRKRLHKKLKSLIFHVVFDKYYFWSGKDKISNLIYTLNTNYCIQINVCLFLL
jgi:hypothetical protein